MDILYLIFIFAVSFIFRISVRIFYPNYTGSDTYFHLYFISHIRKHNGLDFYEDSKFIKPSNFYYPWLTHQLISKLPQKYDTLVEKYFNSLLDTIYTIILYLVTFYITRSNNLAFEVALLYIFLPLCFTVQTLGPRIHSFTPRLFGEITASLVFIFEYLYFENTDTIYLIFATICVVLVILSSRFSLQALLFVTLISFFFNFDFELFIPVFAGFTIFLTIYGKNGIKLLENHYYHMKIFFKNHNEKKSFISANNSLKTLIKSLKSGSIIHLYSYLIYQNTLSSLLIKAPIIILFLFLASNYNFNNYQYIFAFSGIIVFIIVSIKPLLFLGEAERYINHIIFFILLGCVDYLDTHHRIFIFFILYGILFFILDFIYLSKYLSKQYSNTVIARLKKFDKVYNVFSIPPNLSGSWKIAYETKHNLLHPVQWQNIADREKFRSFLLEYETIDLTKIEELIKEYNLDIIVIYKKLLQRKFDNKLIIPKGYKLEELDKDIYILLKKI